jgi:hypothetical protein
MLREIDARNSTRTMISTNSETNMNNMEEKHALFENNLFLYNRVLAVVVVVVVALRLQV